MDTVSLSCLFTYAGAEDGTQGLVQALPAEPRPHFVPDPFGSGAGPWCRLRSEHPLPPPFHFLSLPPFFRSLKKDPHFLPSTPSLLCVPRGHCLLSNTSLSSPCCGCWLTWVAQRLKRLTTRTPRCSLGSLQHLWVPEKMCWGKVKRRRLAGRAADE